MTPKEKAKELYELFNPIVEKEDFYHDDVEHENSKKAALICVDEIIQAIDWHKFEVPNKQFEYWQEVKQEIEKLV